MFEDRGRDRRSEYLQRLFARRRLIARSPRPPGQFITRQCREFQLQLRCCHAGAQLSCANRASSMKRLVCLSAWIILVVFGLSIETAHAFGQAACETADPVRLQFNGTEYRIPAALQPDYSPPEALPTRDYFPNGVRAKRYCRNSQDAPAFVDRIAFPPKQLSAWASQDANRAELASIFPLGIYRSSRSINPVAEGGQPTPDGLFRKITRGQQVEITSTEPIFFGSIISAGCGPAATQQPSARCTIWGRLPDGSAVSLGVLDSEKPMSTWPRMLQQVEAFISSMTLGGR